MQGEFGLDTPQGPCIINFVTIAYNSGNVSLSGISAHTMESSHLLF